MPLSKLRYMCLAGLNVVLISRTESRLRAAAEELEAKYKVETKVVVVDFSKADAVTWETIKVKVARLPASVLLLTHSQCVIGI